MANTTCIYSKSLTNFREVTAVNDNVKLQSLDVHLELARIDCSNQWNKKNLSQDFIRLMTAQLQQIRREEYLSHECSMKSDYSLATTTGELNTVNRKARDV